MNLLVGDSHSNGITFENYVHLLCTGGSAKGLNNPHSRSQYNHIIINNVNTNDYKHLFFLFGGVDTDFSYVHKYLENHNINYVDFNLSVVKNYLNFILINFYNKSVIILSAGLPVLDDENLKKCLLNESINFLEEKDLIELENELSNAILPNIVERTNITLNFNEQLKNEVNRLGNPNIKFLDITSFTYDVNLGRIKDDFFTKFDHHNSDRTFFYTEIINTFLNSLSN
jgi:hypothetical protein